MNNRLFGKRASPLIWSSDCRCGNKGTRTVARPVGYLCEGCFFRYTVMEAAGRADEFWAKFKADYGDLGGWVSYNVKFTVSSPDTTMRIRHIKAPESTT